ncbi:MAG TPA: helix-turn-helix domain-containing protein [Accumulibacter sp.]|nr:helix-turn-helix domain-containing protein [Accumulibacter sp.]HNC17427.1 helix-turn-helix domain-containing protein [Accumulibacter sp.]HND78815.1 helix-turn-helix domain-containing protein [Accumulibacter sp.]HNE13754.1 helix-turn-helix domain-containing protein [Accumulibacter sp.]HNG39968.1 helix-turn-helix domain-containing protein [Accumulibacter sp.]
MSMASIPGTGGIMTIREVTDDLTVTERTIYRLAIAKETPSLKVDDSWRFSRANIDTWITEQSTVASPGDADKEI